MNNWCKSSSSKEGFFKRLTKNVLKFSDGTFDINSIDVTGENKGLQLTSLFIFWENQHGELEKGEKRYRVLIMLYCTSLVQKKLQNQFNTARKYEGVFQQNSVKMSDDVIFTKSVSVRIRTVCLTDTACHLV